MCHIYHTIFANFINYISIFSIIYDKRIIQNETSISYSNNYFLSLLTSCKYFEKVDQRTMPDTAKAKARKNVEEGRGVALFYFKRGGGGNFEFIIKSTLK